MFSVFFVPRLNLREAPVTHTSGLGGRRLPCLASNDYLVRGCRSARCRRNRRQREVELAIDRPSYRVSAAMVLSHGRAVDAGRRLSKETLAL